MTTRTQPHGPPSALAMCCLGLFTFSWERFATVQIGALNLRVSVVFFALGFIMALLRRSEAAVHAANQWILLLLGLIVVWMGIRAGFAVDRAAGVGATARVIAGCLVPYVAIVRCIRSRSDLTRALRWTVAGVATACAFGIYQLVAFHVGLPQFITYTSTSGGAGRISSFSYEAATFGVVVLIGFAAHLSLLGAHPARRPVSLSSGLMVVAGALANARSLFIEAPMFVVLALPVAASRRIRALLATVVVFGLPAIVALLLFEPGIYQFIAAQFASIFDPHEQTSNARRLKQYDVSLGIARENVLFGIGPGNLFNALRGNNYGVFDGDNYADVVANNVWIQAAIDGGVVLLALQLALVGVVLRVWMKHRRDVVARPLVGVWLTVIGIAGMLGSNFYDLSRWVLLALCVTALGARSPERCESREPLRTSGGFSA